MKQTPLKRKSAMKRSQPRRDWTEARAKVDAEGKCRVCRATTALQAAHVVGREHDCEWTVPQAALFLGEPMDRREPWPVAPDRIIPLCQRDHSLYDAHELDILHVLTLEEQVQAVRDAGGIENARKRLAPSCYRPSRGERDDEQRG